MKGKEWKKWMRTSRSCERIVSFIDATCSSAFRIFGIARVTEYALNVRPSLSWECVAAKVFALSLELCCAKAMSLSCQGGDEKNESVERGTIETKGKGQRTHKGEKGISNNKENRDTNSSRESKHGWEQSFQITLPAPEEFDFGPRRYSTVPARRGRFRELAWRDLASHTASSSLSVSEALLA